MDFIKGLALCEDFFNEIAKPILGENFPKLKYSAAKIGSGSDVLGYDDEVSSDHMWGPSFQLFLSDEDIHLKEEILKVLGENFPSKYKGYPVNFSNPDGGGMRIMEESEEVSPLVFIYTIDEYFMDFVGTTGKEALSAIDWLAICQNKLLGLNSGKIFKDDLNLSERLLPFKYYPEDVWRYLLASNWSLIGEEQAFTKRCSDVGDELGSRLVCARICERLIRLCFLYKKQYAPYSKWFGTGFKKLDIDPKIKELINEAICANDIKTRENALVKAQSELAKLHNELNVTGPVNTEIEKYFTRDILVVFVDDIAGAISETILDKELKNIPLIGALSEISNFTTLTYEPINYQNIKALYRKNEDVKI